ncbi:MAG: hypothetical protein LUD47_06895, partial [Clostridia bacterium]|nr:hypothetical protein [Clostridia bacterium]
YVYRYKGTYVYRYKGTYVYRYKGTYVVSIKLSDELLSYGGLQVIYIGADGKAEIYDTAVTDDGYLVFTTTHFSEFIILSSDVEPDTGADAGEEVPSVPVGSEGEGATTGKRGGKPPVEIIVILAIIAASAVAIIIIMCESSKSGKKS